MFHAMAHDKAYDVIFPISPSSMALRARRLVGAAQKRIGRTTDTNTSSHRCFFSSRAVLH